MDSDALGQYYDVCIIKFGDVKNNNEEYFDNDPDDINIKNKLNDKGDLKEYKHMKGRVSDPISFFFLLSIFFFFNSYSCLCWNYWSRTLF
jgi:hypothetical protein